MDLSVEKFRPFKGLTKEVIVRFFGRGRTMKRRGKFAAEGYLSDITITHGESDATVSSSCWASQTKNKAHKIFLAIDTSSYEPLSTAVNVQLGEENAATFVLFIITCALAARFCGLWRAFKMFSLAVKLLAKVTMKPLHAHLGHARGVFRNAVWNLKCLLKTLFFRKRHRWTSLSHLCRLLVIKMSLAQVASPWKICLALLN